MADPDKLQEEMEVFGNHLQELIMRTKEQERDINELKEELNSLKEDTISPESPQ